MEKIILTDVEPGMNPASDELAKIIVDRLGLSPRKENSTQDIFRVFLEFYERSKQAAQQKNPEIAVITVEEMAIYAKISRQTMYEYLRRWTNLNIIIKTSYIKDTRVIIGYRLNGNTLESAFDKARMKITNNLETTQKYVFELQRILKNEKIAKSQKGRSEDRSENRPRVFTEVVDDSVNKNRDDSEEYSDEYSNDKLVLPTKIERKVIVKEFLESEKFKKVIPRKKEVIDVSDKEGDPLEENFSMKDKDKDYSEEYDSKGAKLIKGSHQDKNLDDENHTPNNFEDY